MAAASEVQILNTGESPQENLLSAVELSKELQKLMLKMKGNFISEEGRAVDYSALKESDLFKEYLERTKSLKAVDLGSLERTEKIAFFLNIYNSLTIHSLALCDNGIPSSVLEINNFWRRTAYNIGGYTFSLDDIEHGILRGNRAHPSGGKPLFGESDPRLQFTVTDVDPRIHFALVCGAKRIWTVACKQQQRAFAPKKCALTVTRLFCQRYFFGTKQILDRQTTNV